MLHVVVCKNHYSQLYSKTADRSLNYACKFKVRTKRNQRQQKESKVSSDKRWTRAHKYFRTRPRSVAQRLIATRVLAHDLRQQQEVQTYVHESRLVRRSSPSSSSSASAWSAWLLLQTQIKGLRDKQWGVGGGGETLLSCWSL